MRRISQISIQPEILSDVLLNSQHLTHVPLHYSDVIMRAIASQITSLTIVHSTVYSGADQRKIQSSASLAFVRGIHRWPMKSPHKRLVTRKCFHLMTSSYTTRGVKNTRTCPHDDDLAWRHFPHHCPFCEGNPPITSGCLAQSDSNTDPCFLSLARISCWQSSQVTGEFRRVM